MDVQDNSNVEELKTLIQNLSKIITNAVENLVVSDSEENSRECLNQVPSNESHKPTKTLVLKFMHQILNQINSIKKHIKDETRQNLILNCVIDDLKTLLTCTHALLKKQHQHNRKLATRHQHRQRCNVAESLATPGYPLESCEHIFPREVWEAIFDRVGSSKDLLSCAHASPLLSDILEHTKVNWMFDLILPKVSKYLSTDDIKTCWVVNKSWRKAVNNYFQQNPTYVSSYNNVTYKRYMQTNFGSWDYMESFGEHMESYKTLGKNPFPTRSLFLREQTNSLVLLEAAFQRYVAWAGPHVKYFTLCASKYTGEEELQVHEIDYFLTLGKILGHLPNITSLKQYTDLNMGYDGADNERLQEIFSAFPLPNLPHLRNVRVEGDEGDWVVIIKKYATQLVKLDIMKHSLYPEDFNLQFLNLKELYIKKLVRTRELIESISAPALEIFRVDDLDISSFGEDARFEQVVFTIIRKFPNLKHLKLLSNAPVTFQEVANLEDSLYAPKSLEILELKFAQNISFSLLLKFPHLQHLYLHKITREIPDDDEEDHEDYDEADYYEEFRSDQRRPIEDYWSSFGCTKSQEMEVVEIQKHYSDVFCKGNLTIYDSNIWEVLPFLKTLTFLEYSYRSIDKFVYQREQRDALRTSGRNKEANCIARMFKVLPFNNVNEDC